MKSDMGRSHEISWQNKMERKGMWITTYEEAVVV